MTLSGKRGEIFASEAAIIFDWETKHQVNEIIIACGEQILPRSWIKGHDKSRPIPTDRILAARAGHKIGGRWGTFRKPVQHVVIWSVLSWWQAFCTTIQRIILLHKSRFNSKQTTNQIILHSLAQIPTIHSLNNIHARKWWQSSFCFAPDLYLILAFRC